MLDTLDSSVAEILPFRAQIALGDGTNLCAGTIITPQLILTAAICLLNTGVASQLKVIAGGFLNKNIRPGGNNGNNVQIRRIKKIVIHEQFQPFGVENNIALVVLDDDLVFNDYVHSISLPDGVSNLPGTAVLTRSTKSAPFQGIKSTNKIRLSDVQIRTPGACKNYWTKNLLSQYNKDIDTDKVLCAGKTLQGPCYGDEGEPLMCNMKGGLKDERLQLCGIVALGHENCDEGIFVDIRKYVGWILGQAFTLSKITSPSYFRCSNEALILKSLQCDGYDDCGDNSDESSSTCHGSEFFSLSDSPVSPEEIRQAKRSHHKCYTNASEPSVYKYVPEKSVCNGVQDCRLSSDEVFCRNCKKGAFHCPSNNQCISAKLRCDGNEDCADGSDEDRCQETEDYPKIHCEIQCPQSLKCISLKEICDGKNDCGDNSDEQCMAILKKLRTYALSKEHRDYLDQLLSKMVP